MMGVWRTEDGDDEEPQVISWRSTTRRLHLELREWGCTGSTSDLCCQGSPALESSLYLLDKVKKVLWGTFSPSHWSSTEHCPRCLHVLQGASINVSKLPWLCLCVCVCGGGSWSLIDFISPGSRFIIFCVFNRLTTVLQQLGLLGNDHCMWCVCVCVAVCREVWLKYLHELAVGQSSEWENTLIHKVLVTRMTFDPLAAR